MVGDDLNDCFGLSPSPSITQYDVQLVNTKFICKVLISEGGYHPMKMIKTKEIRKKFFSFFLGV